MCISFVIEKKKNKIKYVTKSSGIETDFSVKTNPFTFLNDIKTNKVTVEEAKNSLKDFNKYLNMIRKKKVKKNHQILIYVLMEEMMLSNL